jgi:hypothetical protein
MYLVFDFKVIEKLYSYDFLSRTIEPNISKVFCFTTMIAKNQALPQRKWSDLNVELISNMYIVDEEESSDKEDDEEEILFIGEDLEMFLVSTAYKRVDKKIRPVPGVYPEEVKVERRFPHNPLEDLPTLPTQPPYFTPTKKLTQE